MKRISAIILSVIVFFGALAQSGYALGGYEPEVHIQGGETFDYLGDHYYYFKTADSFASGSGTESDPYIVSSWEQLGLMREYGCGSEGIGRYFVLDTDLYNTWVSVTELSAPVGFSSIGTEEKPFEGVFDAKGHKINAVAWFDEYLFGAVGENGVVKNIKRHQGCGIAQVNHGLIEKCDVLTGVERTGTDNVGGIAGENTGIIKKCTVRRSGSGNDYNICAEGTGIGGIVGYNDGGTVSECYSNILIRGTSSSRAIGGIAGDNSRGLIKDCVAEVRIETGGSETGGIAGRLNDGTIENCVVTGGWIAGSYETVGSLIGGMYGDSKIVNCHAPDDYQHMITVGNATPETAEYGLKGAEMKTISTYKNFDFDNIWTMREGDFPALYTMYKFPDTYKHWAKDHIEYLAERGIVSGYEDGTFRPDENVTKAELIIMACKAAQKAARDDYNMAYEDIPEWVMPYIEHFEFVYYKDAFKNLAVSDTIFGADNAATRLEAAVIAGAIRGEKRIGSKAPQYTDAGEIPTWAVDPIMISNLSGYEDGSFRPNKTVTRAEAAVMILSICK